MTFVAPWVPVDVQGEGVCSHVQRAPARYDHIDRQPTKRMARAADRGIALRKKHGRGGTRKGRTMAGRISRRVLLGPALIRDMYAFFERFSSLASEQRGTAKWDPLSDDVSNLRIAWDLWGGDAGWAWARRRRAQLDAADEESKSAPESRMLWVQRSAYEERTIEWRNWLESVQRPTETAMRRQWRRTQSGDLVGLLPDQAKRYARRVGEVLGEEKAIRRAVSSREMDAILQDDLEQALLLAGFDSDVVEEGLTLAYARTARRFRLDLVWNPETDPSDQIIGNMITEVQQTTKDRVARIVRAGVDQGVSTSEIQATLLRDSLFGASRALRIARTETAKIVSEGTLSAYGDAASDGVSFKVQWITARDGDIVRPTHQELEGETVDVGEDFEIESTGERGAGPGLFESASEVVNCRCATRPVDIVRPV